MRTRHLWPMAAVALVSTAAFAQSNGSLTSTRQSSRQPETSVTFTGCIQREADYRKTHDLGKGGTAGTGAGRSNEYVLINAARGAASADVDCSFQGQVEAYELTGPRERDLGAYVGKVLQISGTLKEAKTKPLPSGEQAPTGGFDPLKKDLRLFEVEVDSFQLPAGATAAAQPSAPPDAAQRSSDLPATDARAPQPNEPPRQIARAESELPATASPLALTGLIGLLSFAGAVGVRFFR
jgi:hypothetical protein